MCSRSDLELLELAGPCAGAKRALSDADTPEKRARTDDGSTTAGSNADAPVVEFGEVVPREVTLRSVSDNALWRRRPKIVARLGLVEAAMFDARLDAWE
jgi:hypothetical protein